MMAGYLRSAGLNLQRHRVREALRTVDPSGTATRWGKTVSRRVYRVAMPNSLWHLDSHMKLIRLVDSVTGRKYFMCIKLCCMSYWQTLYRFLFNFVFC